MDELPTEVLQKIFRHVHDTRTSLVVLPQVCWRWRRVLANMVVHSVDMSWARCCLSPDADAGPAAVKVLQERGWPPHPSAHARHSTLHARAAGTRAQQLSARVYRCPHRSRRGRSAMPTRPHSCGLLARGAPVTRVRTPRHRHCPFSSSRRSPACLACTGQGATGLLTRIAGARTLSLRGCCAHDYESKHLVEAALPVVVGRFKGVTSLCLENCIGVTNGTLEQLATLKQLRSLNVKGCAWISADGLEHIGTMAQLESLDVGFCHLLRAGDLAHLANCQKLSALSMVRCQVAMAQALPHLARLAQLRSLNAELCPGITDESLRCLSQLGRLETLKIGANDRSAVTDAGLGIIGRVATALRHLRVYNSPSITGRGLAALSKLQLLSLELEYCGNISGL